MRSPLDVYGRALVEGGGLRLLERSGEATAAPVHVWTSDETPGDVGLLDRCRGPVLDVGCGPGRLVGELSRRGIPALGVDIAPFAVALTRSRGATALQRSVYQRLPGEHGWGTILLADGNIGIGGDPRRLLVRIRELLAPGGALLVEAGAPGTPSAAVRLRLQDDLGNSDEFPWAHLAVGDVGPAGAEAGLRPTEIWQEAGRWFVALVRP